MVKLNTTSYEAPLVEVIEVEVESGFAASGDRIMGWDDAGESDDVIFFD